MQQWTGSMTPNIYEIYTHQERKVCFGEWELMSTYGRCARPERKVCFGEWELMSIYGRCAWPERKVCFGGWELMSIYGRCACPERKVCFGGWEKYRRLIMVLEHSTGVIFTGETHFWLLVDCPDLCETDGRRLRGVEDIALKHIKKI